jgi:hypothetical protein
MKEMINLMKEMMMMILQERRSEEPILFSHNGLIDKLASAPNFCRYEWTTCPNQNTLARLPVMVGGAGEAGGGGGGVQNRNK